MKKKEEEEREKVEIEGKKSEGKNGKGMQVRTGRRSGEEEDMADGR